MQTDKASDNYLDVAIRFENQSDIRSALSCIYQNVRFRVRDNEFDQLNEDLTRFKIDEAGVDTMLAVLTATAPYKSFLANRRLLFNQVYSALKNRGKMERGLLDGLR